MTLTPSGYVSDLEFDGTSLQRDGTLVMQVTRGLLGAPTVRGDDTIIPHLLGRTPRSRQADRLPIELAGWILAEDPEEFWPLVAEMNTLFDGVALPRVLSANVPGVGECTINARPVGVTITPVVESHAAQIDVLLESVDPYWDIPGS
jgi:hypothetical protein